jgi:hypothetical protein
MTGPELITVSIPGLAALEYDGGGVGQAAMGLASPPSPEEVEDVEVWRNAKRIRAGRGFRVEVTGTAEQLEGILIAMDAYVIGCRDSEMWAEARACEIAAERLRAAGVRA